MTFKHIRPTAGYAWEAIDRCGYFCGATVPPGCRKLAEELRHLRDIQAKITNFARIGPLDLMSAREIQRRLLQIVGSPRKTDDDPV